MDTDTGTHTDTGTGKSWIDHKARCPGSRGHHSGAPHVPEAPGSSPRAQGPVRELIQLRRHHNPVKIHAMACHHAMTWMAWIVHHGAHHNSLLDEFFELCVPTSALVSMAAPAPASVSVRCQCQRQYRCQCQRQCQRQHQSQCQCQYQ